MLQMPTLQLAAPCASNADPTGLTSPEYNATVALYLIAWGLALVTFFVYTLKINTVFALILLLVSVAAWVLAGAYFKVAAGDGFTSGHIQTVSGALLSVVAVLVFGCYMRFTIMAGGMRMSLNLPVGTCVTSGQEQTWNWLQPSIATDVKRVL
ncbi:hypothetical protein BJ170DRAFT_92704 [Xylariales sp. AK1849]|nr:hypothetical protein BJ170DRAFT_92704 [Xylariales sp. AK1849]